MALLRQYLFELRAALEAGAASCDSQEVPSILNPCFTEIAAIDQSTMAESNVLFRPYSIVNKVPLVQ